MTQQSRWPDGTVCGASFSDDMRHRYLLYRVMPEGVDEQLTGPTPKFPTFLMLNPSTATDEVSDPTITRCAGFARSWGYTSFHVVNLFSFRATDPSALRTTADAEGDPYNMDDIAASARAADIVVCAWGAHGSLRNRASDVVAWLQRHGLGDKLRCLGTTKAGHPKHPLYLAANTPLIPFSFNQRPTMPRKGETC